MRNQRVCAVGTGCMAMSLELYACRVRRHFGCSVIKRPGTAFLLAFDAGLRVGRSCSSSFDSSHVLYLL